LAGVESVVVPVGAASVEAVSVEAASAEAVVEALAQVWALELLLGTALELVTKLAQVSS
jgi:hypothetical protein